MGTNKLATTIDNQIELLCSRGMTFGSKEKARENLFDIGYYRLGFYWFPFEETYPRVEKRNHKFKEGTLFENVIQLYYFDFDVRNIFLKYISRIEINFRTKLIKESRILYPIQIGIIASVLRPDEPNRPIQIDNQLRNYR